METGATAFILSVMAVLVHLFDGLTYGFVPLVIHVFLELQHVVYVNVWPVAFPGCDTERAHVVNT